MGRRYGLAASADSGSFKRTPRPPRALAAPSAINSIPAVSSAETSFISESVPLDRLAHP